MARESLEHWHLDKRIPIALIITLFAYGFTGTWWLSTLGNRMEVVERTLNGNGAVREDIATIKEQLRSMEKTVGRIERFLDRAGITKTDKEKI